MSNVADEALMQWAQGSRTWDDYPTALPRAFADWLNRASPAQWHQAADNWNWDYGIPPLQWIASQPDCDLATALLIYYRAEPSYYLQWPDGQVPEHARETFELLNTIKRRVAANDYTRRFAYDERYDRGFEVNSKAAPVSDDPDFPEVLPGQVVPKSAEWNDGYPNQVWEAARERR